MFKNVLMKEREQFKEDEEEKINGTKLFNWKPCQIYIEKTGVESRK